MSLSKALALRRQKHSALSPAMREQYDLARAAATEKKQLALREEELARRKRQDQQIIAMLNRQLQGWDPSTLERGKKCACGSREVRHRVLRAFEKEVEARRSGPITLWNCHNNGIGVSFRTETRKVRTKSHNCHGATASTCHCRSGSTGGVRKLVGARFRFQGVGKRKQPKGTVPQSPKGKAHMRAAERHRKANNLDKVEQHEIAAGIEG